MSKDTERLNKIVQTAFFNLHQRPEITHGLVLNLYQVPGSSDVLFPIYGGSGGISGQLVFYLTAEHPTNGFAFTNAVWVSYDDTYEPIEERIGREMARLEGFFVGNGFVKGQNPQPRITNLDGGDLGIPWKLGQQGTSRACECGAKEGESHFQFCPMWEDLLGGAQCH